MDLLQPNTGLMFWTLVTFGLLYFFLYKLAWKPLSQALEKRENTIRDSLERAEQAQKKADESLKKYEALLNEARKEAQELIAKSKKTAENMREEAMSKAREDAEKLLERAKNEINVEREKAVDEVKKLAVELSIIATKKAIGKSLTEKDHHELIGQSLKEMGDLN